MKMDFVPSLLALLFSLTKGNVLLIPPNICSSTEIEVAMCTSLKALRHCTNSTLSTASDSYVTRDAYLVGWSLRAREPPMQLVVLSKTIVSVLSEYVALSSTGISRALGALTRYFNWNRLLVVADSSNPYFLHTAEEFYSTIKDTASEVTFVQPQGHDTDILNLVETIERNSLKIIVLSVRPSFAFKLLCVVREKKWFWPEYAWIIHSIDLNSNVTCGDVPGILSLVDHGIPLQQYFNASRCTSMSFSAVNTDVYNTSTLERVPSPTVEITIRKGSSQISITNYSYENNTISSINFVGPIPTDLPPQYTPIGFIFLYYFGVTVSFLAVTVNLVLYIYFRKEPTVKATSVPLSILIFAGCYLLMIYLLDINFILLPSHHKRSKHFRNSVCVIAALFGFIEYPLVLIFSTLIMKLLRVYRIFKWVGKMNKYTYSNLALAGYALLISSPSMLLLLVWMISDPYTDLTISSFKGGFLHVTHDCVCSYELQWALGNLAYLFFMAICLTVVAFLTRKIQYKNFKETKALTSLSFIIVFTTTVMVSYWYIARQIGAHDLVFAIIQFGVYCIILECQGFIFAPKLYPIIKNRILKKLKRAYGVPISKGTCSTATDSTNIITEKIP